MDKRQAYMTPVSITSARMKFYDELNDNGKFLVDSLAEKLKDTYLQRRKKVRGLGELGFRELAIVYLEKFWNGELPDWFVEVLDER